MASEKPVKEIGTCRFYEKKYPDLDDLVMVKIRTISPSAAYVHLLEYNNVEGMISMSEVSRRRIRSIGKHLKVGGTEVVQVIRVDKEKGYIDLSKKKVMANDKKKCEENYNHAKAIHSIMTHVARQADSITSLEECYKKVAWPLAAKYKRAYDAFRLAYANPEKVLGPLELDEQLYSLLVKDIEERLKTQPLRICADVEVTCFTYEGVDAVKEVLMQGQKMGTEKSPLKIILVAPPLYSLRIPSLDRDEGFKILNEAIERMTALIKAKGGNLKVDKAPFVVSDGDKKEEGKEENSEDEEEEESEESEESEGEIMEPSQVKKGRKWH